MPPFQGEAMIAWSKFSGKVEGLLVEGDKTMPPTTWWNFHWLYWFGWKRVVVFEVSPEIASRGFHVGFKQGSEAKVHFATCRVRRFKLRLGHEDCTFFAIDDTGREVPIKLLDVAGKDEDWHLGAELF
jgi:hypothetical protein